MGRPLKLSLARDLTEKEKADPLTRIALKSKILM